MVSRITAGQAEALAAATMRIKSAGASELQLVERLDQGNPYFLIVFGDPGLSGAVVAVDALAGEITLSAKLERVERPWLLEKAKAIELAGCTQPLAARLVWAPSRATRSPFYPLWEVTCESKQVYIDRDGRTWHELLPAGPG
jgi:hypothetical protein